MKYILILSLLLCFGCSETPTHQYAQVDGPTADYLVWYMYDNNLWLFVQPMPYPERINVVVSADRLAPARDTIIRKSYVEEVEEFDSCDPLLLRQFIQENRTDAKHLYVHIAGHGIPGWGMGPDYSAQSVMQWSEIAQAVDGLNVDVLTLDGCQTFDPEMIALLKDTGTKYMVGSKGSYEVGVMSPPMRIMALASHDWTPLKYCQQHWGSMPEAFGWVTINNEGLR